MLFIRLLRYLRGYICFTASDGFPERFLNLCNQADVIIWETSWRSGSMHGKTDRQGFAAMHNCAVPAGVILKATCKRGLPFFLYEYRRRAGLLIGLVFCIASLAVLSGMVWSIEIQGNERIADEEILQVMEARGLRLGARRRNLDAKAMSEIALEQLPGVSWIALILRGSSAVIELREELPLQPGSPEMPQNIIAAKAGQLRILEIYMGSAEAAPGQAVYPGMPLAGGLVKNLDESTRLVPAEAYAVARTNIICEAVIPRRSITARVTPLRTHYTLRFLSFRIPVGPHPRGPGDALELNSSFTWAPRGRAMPLGVDRLSLATLQPQDRIKNDRQLQLAACEAFFDQFYRELRAVQVLEQEVFIELLEEYCKIMMDGRAYENIGVAQVIH